MAVPDYQSFMLPLLQFAADGREHNQREAKDALSRHFNITESNRREMLPSGRQDRFKSSPPLLFEHLVVELLVAMGYGGSRQDAGEMGQVVDTTRPVEE